ncbi:murein transglycosylase A [Aeromonas schubertii]|uniref:peptidoglycan lytic exotransglycosylase n=1 Tax=Aeromonas schubertii TaxID=652 RepID=A0ABS7VFE3_9GAMM|nr:murein transglycosylase A [Aeromonas schubertii]MBZ6067756.1 murein transglycosylase A [Aeromonas schubertii]
MKMRSGWWLAIPLALGGCAGSGEAPKKAVKPTAESCFVDCNQEENLGRQYLDGSLPGELNHVTRVNSKQARNFRMFGPQSQLVVDRSKRMASRYGDLYYKLNRWIAAGGDPAALPGYGISLAQMGGADRQGNILFTGYFSPVLEVRRQKGGEFKYPLYAMPNCGGRCPSRAQIHQGALANRGLELGYSKSLIDNFLMDVQGSGFVHYGESDQLQYLGYAGKNGHGYVSVGRVLIDRGEVAKEKMSLKAIKEWADSKSEAEVKELVENNPSYVFFQRRPTNDVIGAAGIPLLGMAAVAADRRLLPMGTPILAEVPLLDKEGNWTGRHELRLLIALDTGGAVKGGHLDLYHGMGEKAGLDAGHYKHFGRVWKLGLHSGPTAAPWVY